MALVTPTRKKVAYEQVAMLLAEHGLEKISDVKTLLTYDIPSVNTMNDFKKIFSNWGNMIRALELTHRELMELAKAPKVQPKVQPKAKPATKVASKKEK